MFRKLVFLSFTQNHSMSTKTCMYILVCVCMCRFAASESVSGTTQAKASVVRGIRTKLTEQYPDLTDYINDIIPKKEPLHILKW